MLNMHNQAPEHLLPLCGSGRGTLPSPFGANRACGKSLEKSRQQVTNNLLVKSVGIKLLFQVSWHFLLLARLFIIRELILIFVSLTIRFDCGVHFAFIYLFRSSVCGICNLTINEKNGLKMHLNSIFDTQMNWKDIDPPLMYCVVHSAGTLQLDNCRLIGCLISFIRSAGFNRLQYIGSAGKAQI